MTTAHIQPRLLGDTAGRLADAHLGAPLSAQAGWPRRVNSTELPTEVARIGLDSVGSGPLWCALDLGWALALAERAVGGGELPAVAAPGERMAGPQLGVVAYVVARWLAESGAPWLVREVTQASALPEPCVQWPLDVALGASRGRVVLALPPSTAREVRLDVELELAAEALAAAPEPGDLLVPERLSLSGAPGDWFAQGVARITGFSGCQGHVADLDGPRLRGSASPPLEQTAGGSHTTRVLLTLGSLPLWELASLAEADTLSLPCAPGALRVTRDASQWEAEAVTVDGQPALRLLDGVA